MIRERLSSNLEDYLETIFILEGANASARAKEIADRMQVSQASVTGALQSLSEKGLINYAPYSSVTLTPEGFRVATQIMHRHKVLQNFLHTVLKLPVDVAEANACRIEHSIDDSVLNRLTKFAQFVKECPRTGGDWLQAFTRFCEETPGCPDCGACMEECRQRFLDRKGAE